jgi:aldehyde reductase
LFVVILKSPENEVKQAVHLALEAGYRHIDTAYQYMNEAAIGDVIQDWIKCGKLKREELFITTKVCIIM